MLRLLFETISEQSIDCPHFCAVEIAAWPAPWWLVGAGKSFFSIETIADSRWLKWVVSWDAWLAYGFFG